MQAEKQNRILVIGGGTYLGINIASALLAEGAEVTLLVRPGAEARLGALAERVRWQAADVWDVASLKGHGRGQGTVIHTVGSMVEDTAQGLSYQRLNVISARNVANMCVSDGVPHMVLMSATAAPWVNRRYVKAKREAETYLERLGLKTTIIRAPVTYIRSAERPLFYRMMTALGSVPPLSWLWFGRIAPMPLDILARGVARAALNPPEQSKRILYAPDLRRLNTPEERRGLLPAMQAFTKPDDNNLPFETLDDDTPFGWIPSDVNKD